MTTPTSGSTRVTLRTTCRMHQASRSTCECMIRSDLWCCHSSMHVSATSFAENLTPFYRSTRSYVYNRRQTPRPAQSLMIVDGVRGVRTEPDLREQLIGGDANNSGHQYHLEGAHCQALRSDSAWTSGQRNRSCDRAVLVCLQDLAPLPKTGENSAKHLTSSDVIDVQLLTDDQ